MENKFEVLYWRGNIRFADDKDTFLGAVKFINFLDSYGGYADEIRHKGLPIYRRRIDEENGSDYWINENGKVVNLEQERR
jgi:hypothetical protein